MLTAMPNTAVVVGVATEEAIVQDPAEDLALVEWAEVLGLCGAQMGVYSFHLVAPSRHHLSIEVVAKVVDHLHRGMDGGSTMMIVTIPMKLILKMREMKRGIENMMKNGDKLKKNGELNMR